MCIRDRTDTMNAQLSIIKDQEKNSAESTRLNNQAINRQLDIINDQNGFLKKIFDHRDCLLYTSRCV